MNSETGIEKRFDTDCKKYEKKVLKQNKVFSKIITKNKIFFRFETVIKKGFEPKVYWKTILELTINSINK